MCVCVPSWSPSLGWLRKTHTSPHMLSCCLNGPASQCKLPVPLTDEGSLSCPLLTKQLHEHIHMAAHGNTWHTSYIPSPSRSRPISISHLLILHLSHQTGQYIQSIYQDQVTTTSDCSWHQALGLHLRNLSHTESWLISHPSEWSYNSLEMTGIQGV